MSGKLITFEGPEGAGKTTQIKLLKEYLEKEGLSVITTHEPGGGSELSQRIREILLGGEFENICDEAELLLMLAARVEHVQKLILPHLRQGMIVLCDRFIDSTVAYQGYGRGLPLKSIQMMNQFAICGRYPDLTIVFDIDPETGLKRAAQKAGLDRIESAGMEFHTRVREGFEQLALEGGRYFLVDGSRSMDEVHQDILKRVLEISTDFQ